jgi:hypothetical protein
VNSRLPSSTLFLFQRISSYEIQALNIEKWKITHSNMHPSMLIVFVIFCHLSCSSVKSVSACLVCRQTKCQK